MVSNHSRGENPFHSSRDLTSANGASRSDAKTVRQQAESLREQLESEQEAEAERQKLMIVEELLEIMEKRGISRKELARRMGVAPSRITSMLNGTNNFTIETLVRAARAVDAKLKQSLVPIEK